LPLPGFRHARERELDRHNVLAPPAGDVHHLLQ
jgi:hypothetical protein